MRYTVARSRARKVKPDVAAQRQRELGLGLHLIETYRQFGRNVDRSSEQLLWLLRRLKQEGKRVVGYAATSKSTTVLNYCGISTDLIEFLTDTTPVKQGSFSPGTHIPVYSPEKFRDRYPDYALLFAWNHAEEVIHNEPGFRQAGGQWIRYVPKVETFV